MSRRLLRRRRPYHHSDRPAPAGLRTTLPLPLAVSAPSVALLTPSSAAVFAPSSPLR